MPFASELRETLEYRDNQVPAELIRGDSLEHVLSRHLLAVEQLADRELVTSILLLSPNGLLLWHGAGPSLPREYREAIDGSEIGPTAGSCGTAAYYGCPVYVTDIATDALWADYKHIALPHGLRSCWSTPIRDSESAVIGTFAIYHRTVGGPSRDEIAAIDMITDSVAEAIMRARRAARTPRLRLVADNGPVPSARWNKRLMDNVRRLETLAANLRRQAEIANTAESRKALLDAAQNSLKLVKTIRAQLG